jgi:hypothetical protein
MCCVWEWYGRGTPLPSVMDQGLPSLCATGEEEGTVRGGGRWPLVSQFSVVESEWGEWLLVVVRVLLESCERPL